MPVAEPVAEPKSVWEACTVCIQILHNINPPAPFREHHGYQVGGLKDYFIILFVSLSLSLSVCAMIICFVIEIVQILKNRWLKPRDGG